MMNAALRGKPDAGNPHVRFDEGEVVSEKPRRGSLLYNACHNIAIAVLIGLSASVDCIQAAGAAVWPLPQVYRGSFEQTETGVLKVTCPSGEEHTHVHFAPPEGLSDAEAIAFDCYTADLSVYSGFELRIIESTKVRGANISPDRQGVWNTVVVPLQSDNWRGPKLDWKAVERVKITLTRAEYGQTNIFYIGNLRAVYPVKSVAKPGERRLGWVLAHAKDGKDDWEATAAFFAKWGLTDMIALVARGGCAYYDSKVLPRAKGLKEGLSPAREAIEACHRHGLKCHLWKTCWQVRSDTPKDYLQLLESEQRFQVNDRGQMEKGWLCPSDERNRAAEIAVMKELAELGADGIHFDYIRHNDEKGCYCSRCLESFSKSVGRKVASAAEIRADAELAAKWADFRAELISTVVRDVSDFVHRHSPRIEVSAAVFRDPVRDRVHLGQDWSRWCREGWLDIICPMNYKWSPDIYRGIIRRQKEALNGTNVQYCPGIGIATKGWKKLPPDHFRDQVAIVREYDCSGFAVFAIGKNAEECYQETFGFKK